MYICSLKNLYQNFNNYEILSLTSRVFIYIKNLFLTKLKYIAMHNHSPDFNAKGVAFALHLRYRPTRCTENRIDPNNGTATVYTNY